MALDTHITDSEHKLDFLDDGASASEERMRWHESWILRAALAVMVVLLLCYGGNVLYTIQTVNSVSKVAYDPEIASALSDHLKTIKDNHELNQALYLDRLKSELDKHSKAPFSKGQVEAALYAVDTPPLFRDVPWKVSTSTDPQLNEETFRWQSATSLRVGNVEINFEKNPSIDSFHDIESVLQRYQFIGAALDADIKPSLVRSNTIVLAVGFFVILVVFGIMIYRFRRSVSKVIRGFKEWAEQDKSFRFGKKFSGELRLITSHFNAMADDVEESRRKSMYLEKLASWQTIARKMAHEIKNPLTPIQMMVSQLRRSYKGEDKSFQELLDNAQEIITEEITSLRRLVDNFSNFARLPAPQMQQTDIIPIAQRTVDLQQAAFPAHQISMDAKDPSIMFEFDPDLVRQVLNNLIKNAAEASIDTPASINLSIRSRGMYVDLIVADNGPGIPEDIQKNIFEAYFTTKHSGPNTGMGLGLAICKKIAMDHQGELTLKSVPGHTEFTLRLPREQRKDLP